MSLGGGKSQSTTDVRLNGININQSNYGNAIPLVYGQNRIPLMLLWYGNWIPTPHTQSQPGGKGGGGGSSNTTFTYSASMIMGLCEGQITGVGQVWKDKTISSLAALGLTLFSGAGGQATWSYLTTNFPSQAVPYDHTAYVAIANMQLGSSAALPNHTFEVTGFLPFNVGTINDAEPSAILIDYTTDVNHGANFNALGVIQGVGTTTYQSYCLAMGFFLSPYEATQRAAVDFIKEILRITNSDGFMSAGVLNIVPYADTSVTGNGRTYTPNLTPLFSFTDDDFRAGGANGDPVIIDRKPLAQTYNTVRVEYLNRANAYNIDIAEATDAQDIALNGVRVMPTITFHSITTLAVARQVAQIIMQRQLYIRSTFTFPVRADYCLLEPMDLVSITDSVLGIVNKLVRIIEVDDDQGDNITLIAEDMLVGTASAPLYNWQASQGYASNYGVAPPSVAAPLIFTMPPLLVDAGGGYQLGICVDQGAAGSWSGCDVYMSLDNASYILAGTINGAARYGTLTASLASHADPDTVDTLAIALTNPATTTRQIVSGSAADYNNLRTLIYVDGEIMAYQTAALTSAGNYNLTTLRRGQYGSSPALHAIGSSFARIDAGVFRVPFDPGMMGQTVYFKFCSFNVYQQATQSLAGATAYSHVLSSTNAGQLMPGPLTLVGRGVTVAGNNNGFKSAATTAWDSDVYSVQGYTNGAFASFRPVDVTSSFMVGLDTNPTLDSNYTSINYAISCQAGVLQVYELGVSAALAGLTYAAGDDLTVMYDGNFVRYLKNGALLRQVPAAANLTLYLDSSFNTPQAMATNLKFGPYGTATPQAWIARGTCVVADTNITKLASGASGWTDGDAYSINGYTTCHLVAKANDTTHDVMLGLVSGAPPAAINFTGLSYAINLQSGGTTLIYEAGVSTGVTNTFNANDYFAITYDGATVFYVKNGAVMRTVAAAGLTMFADIDVFHPGGGVNSLEFGPSATVPLLDTPQIGANAATDIGSVSLPTYTGSAIAQLITSVAVAAKPQAYTATVTVSADVWKTSANPAQCWLNVSTGVVVSQPFTIPGTASPGTRIGIVFSWPVAANTAVTFGFFYNSATVGNFGNAANIDLRVDVVKK